MEPSAAEPTAADQLPLLPDSTDLARAFFERWAEIARHQYSYFRPVYLMPWDALTGPERAAFVAGLDAVQERVASVAG